MVVDMQTTPTTTTTTPTVAATSFARVASKAPDAAHAAAWSVVAAVQLALYVSLVGVVISALVPDAVLRPLRLVQVLVFRNARVRRAACVVYHTALGVLLLGLSVVLAYEALVAARGMPGAASVSQWLCQRDALSSVYGRPKLVRAQAGLLVSLFVAQFAERVAYVVLGARRVSLALRVARAFSVSGLWVATASAVPLSVPLAVCTGVNVALDHLAEAAATARGADLAWYLDLSRAVLALSGGGGLIISAVTVIDCRAGRRTAAISIAIGFGHVVPLCLAIARALAVRMFVDAERLHGGADRSK